ncbi:MAG: nitroreductase family protein [Candidatus Thermoplasmatota archaeon]|nr:nitroreductase family protein [Candidatus Thermoplasmatota archaeon]
MEVVEAIRARRAKRAIDARPVENEKIQALVEAARLSASCFNNQPWRIVICKGPEVLEKVKGTLAKGNVWATRAPVIMVIAARPPDDCQLSDRRDYFLFSTGLAIGQLELRATELGLIAHPIAGYNPQNAKNLLGIPEDFVVITYVIVGYPGADDSLLSDKQKQSETVRPDRKPVGENFYLDTWGNPFG